MAATPVVTLHSAARSNRRNPSVISEPMVVVSHPQRSPSRRTIRDPASWPHRRDPLPVLRRPLHLRPRSENRSMGSHPRANQQRRSANHRMNTRLAAALTPVRRAKIGGRRTRQRRPGNPLDCHTPTRVAAARFESWISCHSESGCRDCRSEECFAVRIVTVRIDIVRIVPERTSGSAGPRPRVFCWGPGRRTPIVGTP